MKSLFDALGAYLHGRASLEKTLQGLGDVDSERLAIYGRFCAAHRHEALALFEETRAACGERWPALVDAYFAAQPMRHVEINENGAAFPAWLATQDVARFIAELADFEWWTWRTRTAPDEPADSAPGPLRLASTVELRPYAHDLLGYLEATPRPVAPREENIIVLFWRDADLDARYGLATRDELVLLQRVSQGLAVESSETLDDLRAAGVLLA